MADVALWLGPYMSISSKNIICTGTQKVWKFRQITTNQKLHKPARRPANPQPDLRFVKRNSKPDTQKGQEPKQKHPQKRFAIGHSGLTLRHTQKHAKNELSTTTFSETWKSKHHTCLRWHRCKELYMITGIQICLSQRPLRCACTEGHNVRDLTRPFSVGKNVAVVIVPRPPAGGHTVVALRKIRRPVKIIHTAIAKHRVQGP